MKVRTLNLDYALTLGFGAARTAFPSDALERHLPLLSNLQPGLRPHDAAPVLR